MFVERIVNNLLSSNTFLLSQQGVDVVYLVDAGDFSLLDVTLNGRSVTGIFLTHAHLDHIYGLNEVLERSPNASVYTNVAGQEMLLDAKKNLSYYHETPFIFNHPNQIRLVKDGQKIEIGYGIVAQAVFTPGHNPSCITWIVEDDVFSGDSYIPGVKTVTNLPGGNKAQAIESEMLIKQISVNKTVFPGHYIGEDQIRKL